jgi:hypothetical protein
MDASRIGWVRRRAGMDWLRLLEGRSRTRGG